MRKSYRPRYHVSVPFGWANDPNGTIFFRGRAHLYYQHYPHKSEWGPMHWGHVSTEDFVHWQQHPVALYPDQPYELVCGCCSGGAVEADGKLYLLYTAAQPMMQRQCLAVSGDGDAFVKAPDNPVLTAEMLSPEVYEEDFRDPRIFKKDGFYYMLAGIRYVKGGVRVEAAPTDQRRVTNPLEPAPEHKKEGWGNLCLLRGTDLRHWEYVGHLLHHQPEFDGEFYRLNGVYECPDYFVAENGAEVLLSSPQNLPQLGHRYQNIHSTIFMLGHLDFETGQFVVKTIDEVDSGFDIYAAQTLRHPDGRVIMLAWKEMWDRSIPTAKSEQWAGTYTLPRELSVEGERLIQRPVREIERFRANPVRVDELRVKDESAAVEGVSGTVLELKLVLEPGTAKRAGVKLFRGAEHETVLSYERETGLLVFDRSRSGVALTGAEEDVNVRVCELGERERIELDLFLDVCSVEAFVDGGRWTMTGNVYPDLDGDEGIAFFAEGGAARFRAIEKFEILV